MRPASPLLLLLAAALGMLALGAQCGPPPGITAVRVASGLASPVLVAAPPGDARLFIVERRGTIRILQSNGTLRALPFLDIDAKTNGGGEQGLLGLAFAPDYAESGLFYLNYTDLAGDTVIARYQVSGAPNLALPGSEEILLTIDQPSGNHNGAHLAFGPDGMLYIGMGDGGGVGDPGDNGQDPTTRLGKMLRIDVGGGPGSGYAIPPDNPFADPNDGIPDEIWALGLRNPYRFFVDRFAGLLVIADVGQGEIEELDAEILADSAGSNYGWRLKEGTQCFEPPTGCDDGTLDLVDPVHEYAHSEGRCSITGGVTYYGPIPGIYGLHFFGDYCTGEIWSILLDVQADGVVATDLRNRTAEGLTPDAGTIDSVVGFGTGGNRQLYVVDLDGEIFEIVAASD